MNKIVYTDEQDLRIYESLPPTDFKEFFMAYFKYNKGEKVEVTDFTNPITYALFNSYIPKLDKMEDSYNKKANANRENGKKGGRPKKQKTIEPNGDFNIESNTGDLSALNYEDDNLYHQEVESPTEGLKTAKKEEIEVANNNINEEEIDMIKTPSEFSENLTTVINNNEAKIEQMAKVKFNRKYLGLKDETSFKLCKQNYEIITKQLTTEKDRTDFDNFLNYKVIILYNKQYQTA